MLKNDIRRCLRFNNVENNAQHRLEFSAEGKNNTRRR